MFYNRLKSVTGGVFKATLLALMVASIGTACNKSASVEQGTVITDEVVFSAGGPAMNSAVSTKATVVDALPSFYAGCTTGAAGSEVSVWNSTTFTGSGSPMVYKGDKWWPITDPSYHFYASNAALTFAAGGTTVAASNATDVICAYLPEPTYKVRNVLSFEHIFARLGQVTVSASASYAISNVSISITPKVSGTYNLRTGAGKTDGTGWSGTVDGSAAVIAARAAELARSGNFSQANDIYLVPGSYTISATWTATAPGYSETFSNKTQEISITAGKVNKITTTLGGRGTEIEFGVEIAAWGETTQDVDFLKEEDNVPSIAGLIFAPGDLYTTGSGFAIADSWEATLPAYENSNVEQGSTVSGRYYFWLQELADLFSSQPLDNSMENTIDNSKTLNGYRMITGDEMNAVLSGSRAGSLVGTYEHVLWCTATISNVPDGLSGSNTQKGIIIFPDQGEYPAIANMTPTVFYDSATGENTPSTSRCKNATLTMSELQGLISSGCVFLPCAGCNYVGWESGGNTVEYWLATTVVDPYGNNYIDIEENYMCSGNLFYAIGWVDAADGNTENQLAPVRLVKSAN